MVIIRLARGGAKKNPYYFVTVADERKPRDGSFIERLGFFNPSARGQEERLRIDLEKLDQWISKGAQLSDRVKKLVKDAKLSPEELQAKLDAKKQKAEEKKALAEKAAKEAGYELKVGKFPFSASGKASAAGHNDGFIKLIFDAKYGELLGGHMIGANVTEMIAEIVALRKLETTGHELIKTVHPHPTMSEAVMEAAAAAYDEVIHI